MHHNKIFLRYFGSLLGLIILFGLLSINASVTLGAFAWQINVIDSTNDVGMSPSLALQPGTDKPYISYYDNTLGDLKLAFPVSSGGDCGPGNSWSCNSIAFQNITDFGLDSSLDFNSLRQWGIAYQNSTLGTNNFRGIPAAGAQEIFWDPIDQSASTISLFNTMKFDQADVSHVSYGLIDLGQSKGFIKHAKYVGLGGNCGGGMWRCETIVQTSTIGFFLYNSLALYGNLPHVFYRDINRHLAMAVNNPAGNCGPANDWTCSDIDTATTVSGLISSYINVPDDYLGIAYIGDGTLRYVYMLTSGTGNCGSGYYEFRCVTIDSVGLADNNQQMAASLGYYNGQPVIAYTDTNDRATTILKIAYPQTNGNCGPLDTAFRHTWRCTVVDSGANTNDLGYYPSLQIDTAGIIHIAYYDYTAGNLKYAVSDTSINSTPVYLPLIVR